MKVDELAALSEAESQTAFYISFSDLMVLLGVFFVMLLSMSRVEIGSFEKVKTSFSGSTAGTLIELSKELDAIVNGTPGVPGVKVHMASDGVRLDLDTGALFESGSSKVKKGALEPLLPLLKKIRETPYTVDVEGHSDDVSLYKFFKIDGERTLETNWSLSGRRAASVIHFIIKSGFKQRRIRLVGYASTRPLKSTRGKRGRALEKIRAENRRVSLLVK